MRRLAILSGPIGCGKTMTCRRVVEQARQRGLDCAGLVSPARFDGARKVGIDLLDVRSGERRPLAEADRQPGELRTTAYRFDVSTVAWGSALLDAACPCDVLIVDELGPLELERGQGWRNALDVLRSGQFRLAVVVVRPALIEAFRRVVVSHAAPLFGSEHLFMLASDSIPNDLPHHVLSLLDE